MSNSLRMYRIIFRSVCKMLDTLRVTRQRNLARLITGIYLGQHVHLSKIANHVFGASQLTSKVNACDDLWPTKRSTLELIMHPMPRRLSRPQPHRSV
jgi:hypothetical protein